MTSKLVLQRLGSAKRLTQSSDKGSIQEPLNPALYFPGT